MSTFIEVTWKVSNVVETERALEKKVKEMFGGKNFILVGFPNPNIKNDDGESIAEYAYKNEMGIGVLPRPFLKPSMKMSKKLIVNSAKVGVKKMINDKTTMDKILSNLGKVLVGAVQNYITDLKYPANSKWWAEQKIKEGAKEGANPLVFTGRMRQAVAFVPTDKQPKVNASYGG